MQAVDTGRWPGAVGSRFSDGRGSTAPTGLCLLEGDLPKSGMTPFGKRMNMRGRKG
jgi:hypothetical protein